MPRGPKVSPEEHQRMAELVSSGHSLYEAGRILGRNPSTVFDHIHMEGIEPANVRSLKPMQDAREYWDVRRRTNLVADGFRKAEELLPTIDKPRDLQSWAVSTGILIDKMRLESDLSTANIEQHVTLTTEQAQAIRKLLLES